MSRCVPTGLSAGAASSCLAKVPKKQHPHAVEVNYRNPEELMQEYLKIARQLETAQNTLKAELMAALGGA